MAKAAGLEKKNVSSITDKNMETDTEPRERVETAGEESVSPSWVVQVKNNPNFCGIGAGGVQFANGKAVVDSGRMAEWFREHDGYEVKDR